MCERYRAALKGVSWTPADDRRTWKRYAGDFYRRLEAGSRLKNSAKKKEIRDLMPYGRRSAKRKG